MTYDAEGRIASSSSAANGTTTYLYGADGQRAGKTAGGIETNYVRDPDGTLMATYIAGGYSGLPQEIWVGGKHFGTVTVPASGSPTQNFSLTNWLGSEAARTDSTTGIPTSAYLSQPYGDAQTTLFGADTNDTHFTGKERDTESGNDYFGARYYGSSMGRFMSPDPSQLYYADPSNPQSFNLYSYGRNNPLVNTDPTGMDCVYDNGDGTFTTNTGDCDNSTEQRANAGHYIDCDGSTEKSTGGTLDPTTGTLSLTDASGNLIPGTNVSDWSAPTGVSTSVMISAKTYGIAMAGYGVPGGFFSYRPNAIGPIPHTPPPPSAFECLVTPTEAMAYHAIAMQIWRQQNGMKLASSTPSDDDTGGEGIGANRNVIASGQGAKFYVGNEGVDMKPFASQLVPNANLQGAAGSNAAAMGADYAVAAVGCALSK